MKLYIKNMVCPRCIMAVQTILNKLNIHYLDVRLGEVIMDKLPDNETLAMLRSELKDMGFDLLDDSQYQIIEQIKSVIIRQIHYNKIGTSNFSEILVSELHRDYSYISKLFSATEGITIEHYIILQKIERVKELLSYDQQTLSEISIEMGYSSVAHLSAQFKKVTGMTPSQFKSQDIHLRKGLDEVGF